MDDILKIDALPLREVAYRRQRFKNRVHAKIVEFIENEAKKTGITRKAIGKKLSRDPSQITRWLSSPGNLTLDSISDLLLAFDSEPEPPEIHKLVHNNRRSYIHPLMQEIATDDRKHNSQGNGAQIISFINNGWKAIAQEKTRTEEIKLYGLI